MRHHLTHYTLPYLPYPCYIPFHSILGNKRIVANGKEMCRPVRSSLGVHGSGPRTGLCLLPGGGDHALFDDILYRGTSKVG